MIGILLQTDHWFRVRARQTTKLHIFLDKSDISLCGRYDELYVKKPAIGKYELTKLCQKCLFVLERMKNA